LRISLIALAGSEFQPAAEEIGALVRADLL
jgi:hypothetical protein